jgi:PAS domain S-box-containing protein
MAAHEKHSDVGSFWEREDYFRKIFEDAPLGMAISGRDFLFRKVNAEFCRIMGYAESELIGMTFKDLTHPEHLAEDEGNIKRLIRGDMPSYQAEKRYVRKDNQVVWGALTVSTIRDASGGFQYFLVMVEDVSGRKRIEAERAQGLAMEQAARAEAEAADQAKDDFLAVVSHELRTPITAVLGWSWLLRFGGLGAKEQNDAALSIERNMRQQQRVVNDILDMSSLVRRQLALNKRPVELAGVLRAACDSIRVWAEMRGVRIRSDAAAGIGTVGDSARLQQVFGNLLHNAVKFSSAGSEVRVRLYAQGEQAKISISDDGRGIDPDFLQSVFEPFRQEENPLVRRYRGIGLGLSIVKQLVDLHGGSVEAYSAGPGRGAEFIVSLALALDAQKEARIRPPSHPSPRELSRVLTDLDIVVVDDDQDTVQMLSTVLATCGAKVRAAGSGAEAFALVEAKAPELFICDLAMPDEDGFALMARIRQRNQQTGRTFPAVALTAYSDSETHDRALQAGFQCYATKPVDVAEFVLTLWRLAGNKAKPAPAE